MKLIKGDAPGQVYLDVSEDTEASAVFRGKNPELCDIRLNTDYRQTLGGDFRMTYINIECDFRDRNPIYTTEVTTRHNLTSEQISRIIDILVETDARAADYSHSLMP